MVYAKTDIYGWEDGSFEPAPPKSFLEPSIVVRTRDGCNYICINGRLVAESRCPLCSVSDLNDDLHFYLGCDCYKDEIIALYKTNGNSLNNIFKDCNLELIWKRKETKR